MRIFVDGPGPELADGLSLVAAHLRADLVADATEVDVMITVQRRDDIGHRTILDGNTATIEYDGEAPRLWRALGLVVEAFRDGVTQLDIDETPRFTRTGVMIDVSRNAVPTTVAAKWFITAVATMGLRTVMLYTEDTYELEQYPYFGWMRGRYSLAELRELDDHAARLGVELVPCIQVLGHLATMLHWPVHSALRDTPNVLEVGNSEVQALIATMLETVSTTFRSRRVHIGMDETQGLGRGKYLDHHEHRPASDLFAEHLGWVTAAAHAHGLEPMIWSDMLFRTAGEGLPNYRDYDPRVVLPDNLDTVLPAGVRYVFWDYYSGDADFYGAILDEHAKLPGPTVMAGGVWAWNTFAVQLKRSVANALAALRAAESRGTAEVLATIWHNGAESLPVTALAGVQVYAEYDYTGQHRPDEVARRFETCCGASWDELLTWERVEHPVDTPDTVGLARTLLYNDLLGGMADGQIAQLPGVAEHYRDLTAELADQSPAGPFAVVQPMISSLTSVLELKSDFGVRLRGAYRAEDRAGLELLAAECLEIARRLEQLRRNHRAAWFTFHKAAGWEVLDLRYGGLVARCDTVRERLLGYLSGEVSHLDELTDPPLRLDGHPPVDKAFTERHNWLRFGQIYTAGIV